MRKEDLETCAVSFVMGASLNDIAERHGVDAFAAGKAITRHLGAQYRRAQREKKTAYGRKVYAQKAEVRARERAERIERIRAMAASGMSDAAIGKKLGVSATRIQVIRSGAGVESIARRGRPPGPAKPELVRALIEAGATHKGIAACFGVSESRIWQICKDQGLVTRYTQDAAA